MMITKEIAASLCYGAVLYHVSQTNADGSPARCRVTGACKTWKTKLEYFRLPVKHGLRESFYITPANGDKWVLPKATALSTNDDAVFHTDNNIPFTYGKVRAAMKGHYYTMTLSRSDFVTFANATNQGIDSHLEACLMPHRGDSINGYTITLSLESLPVLLRRLFEADNETSTSLANSILTTLGFYESGRWSPADGPIRKQRHHPSGWDCV